MAEVAEVWRRGSVVGSWLVDLTADALARSPQLDDFAGRVSDSGEGRWTVLAAVDEGVPAPVITTSLFERFSSRELGDVVITGGGRPRPPPPAPSTAPPRNRRRDPRNRPVAVNVTLSAMRSTSHDETTEPRRHTSVTRTLISY